MFTQSVLFDVAFLAPFAQTFQPFGIR